MWMTYILLHKNPKTLLTLLKLNTNSKLKELSYHLQANYSNDPDVTIVGQLKEYIEELNEKYIRLFKDNPPKDQKTHMDKIDLPSVYLMIMKTLITKGNPTLMLMPKGATDEKLNNLSRKRCNLLTLLQEGGNRIVPMVPSSGSCSPLSSSYKLK